MMTTVNDVMAKWPTDSDFARDIGLKHPSHAQTMKVRGSIPAAYWSKIVAAAKARGIKGVTLEVLARIAADRASEQPERVA
jgi:hypothetical protein